MSNRSQDSSQGDSSQGDSSQGDSSQGDSSQDSTQDDELDLSWLKEAEQMSKIQNESICEPMNSIMIYSIYVNKHNHIDKISQQMEPVVSLTGGSVGIPNSILMQRVQANKSLSTGIKYRLMDVLLYHVDLEPDDIHAFSVSDDYDSDRFLKKCAVVNDIKIPNSIFIFHSINALYFIFQQMDNPMSGMIRSENQLKSILKSGGGGSSNKKKTKKVVIQPTKIIMDHGHRTTKKIVADFYDDA
jgi:hypothetical protein